MCVHVCAAVHAYVYTQVWNPEVNLRSLPHLPFTLFWKQGASLEQEVYQIVLANWPSDLKWLSWFCLHNAGITSLCYYTIFLYGLWGLNSRPGVCAANTSMNETFSSPDINFYEPRNILSPDIYVHVWKGGCTKGVLYLWGKHEKP